MKTTNQYSYFDRSSQTCLVFVHGLFSSKTMFEKLVAQLAPHSCLFFNLFEITRDLEECDLDTVTHEVVQTLDKLAIANAIFVSSCIGKSIAFQVGIQRPDLIKGQIFIGNVEEEIIPALKDARLALFNYLKHNDKEDRHVSSLSMLMNVDSSIDAKVYVTELLNNIEQDSFEDLYRNIHGRRHFSKVEYQNNRVPNILILPNNSQAARNKPGLNLSIVRVKGTNSEYGMIKSKLFSSELKRSVSSFC